MYILGVSAYYHDSAAVLLKDGVILSAIEEERFTRIKHDNSFPLRAIDWCLKTNKLSINDIGFFAYYEKPLLKFERILDMFIKSWPWSLRFFMNFFPEQLGDKITVENTIRKKLKYKGKIVFVPHHLSHASAAYYSSGFTESAVMTVDGVGEYQTTGLWKGSGNRLTPLFSIHFPHSVGLLYSTFAAFLGFKVNEDEYKLMGLAAYGKPSYIGKVRRVVDVKPDGSFALDMDYFSFRESTKMWSRRFEKLFGKPRDPKDSIQPRHANIALSIQKITEDIYIGMLNHLHKVAPSDNLCISGGVALNALANGQIYAKTPFKHVHVLGPAGDSGAALGAALYMHFQGKTGNAKAVKSLYLGTSYSDGETKAALEKMGLPYRKLTRKELVRQAALALAQGKIIGWYQGKCELGPRALGNRSILSQPAPHRMKDKVNMIKIREQFRPFAGSILKDHVHEYFTVPEVKHSSPYMNFCFTVRPEKRQALAAIVHADRSCRIQTVSPDNGLYYELIEEYRRQTGIACILNTSFNLKGEPIVETPEQAIADFKKTKMDMLFINSFAVNKG